MHKVLENKVKIPPPPLGLGQCPKQTFLCHGTNFLSKDAWFCSLKSDLILPVTLVLEGHSILELDIGCSGQLCLYLRAVLDNTCGET